LTLIKRREPQFPLRIKGLQHLIDSPYTVTRFRKQQAADSSGSRLLNPLCHDVR